MQAIRKIREILGKCFTTGWSVSSVSGFSGKNTVTTNEKNFAGIKNGLKVGVEAHFLNESKSRYKSEA